MRSYHSVCTGNVGSYPGQGMRRSHNDSTRGSSGRASGCGRGRQDLDRTLADGPGVWRTIVRRVVTCIPPRREIYRVNQGRMARNSGFLGKIISTILIAVSGKRELNPRPLGPEPRPRSVSYSFRVFHCISDFTLYLYPVYTYCVFPCYSVSYCIFMQSLVFNTVVNFLVNLFFVY